MQEFTPACTIKKVIRKRPVRAMVIFFPIDEVKICFQVISERMLKNDSLAKLKVDGQKIIFI